MPQYISIDQCWDSPRFNCPACGAEVFSVDGEPTDKPCEHLMFSWIDQVGEFYNASDEINEIIQSSEERLTPDDEEFISSCPDNAVLFALKSCGMACGPASLTVIHAINFPDDDAFWESEKQ
jgi:hypothetical protein